MPGRKKYHLLFVAIALCVSLTAQTTHRTSRRIDSLEGALQQISSDSARAEVLAELSFLYNKISPYDGIKYGEQALAIADSLQWKLFMARANSSLGANYFSLSRFSDAYDYWQRALKIHESINFKPGIARHLHNIGNVFFSQGDYLKAQDYYLKGLKKYEELKNNQDISHSYTALGKVYEAMRDLPRALEYHNKALAMDEAMKMRNGIAEDLMNIGSVYGAMRQYDKALTYLFRSLEARRSTDDDKGLAQTYSIIGRTLLRSAQDSVGGNKSNSANLPRAIAYLDSAIQIDKKTGFLDDLQRSSFYLSETQEVMKNYREALSNYKQATMLKDSIYSSSSNARIFNIERKEEIDAKNHEITLANLEVARKKTESMYFIAGIVLLVAIVALLILVARSAARNYANQKRSNQVITAEKQKSEDLLLNILPQEVADELKEKGSAEAKLFDNVTVFFSDFVGFTKVSERLTPKELVNELNVCFSEFDGIMNKYGIEKIKTVGDAYLAVSGLPVPHEDHAQRIIRAANEVKNFMAQRKALYGDRSFEIRIGVHSGNVVAGIVGVRKFAYDIWGDTVNTAARMEQNSEAGRINISESTYTLVKNDFKCTYRGKIQAKNKGELSMYFVEGKS